MISRTNKENPWKGKVSFEARKELEKHKRSPSGLNQSVPFNPALYLDERCQEIADQLFDSLELRGGYKQDEKHTDFKILLANLFRQTRGQIYISMNQNDYKRTRYNKVSYTNIKVMIDRLLDNGLIEVTKGYKYPEESKYTRIMATGRLLELFPEYRSGVLYKPLELVELHDCRGKLKDYSLKKETEEVRRIRSILTRINEVNSKAVIRYREDKLNTFIVSIFVEKWTWYGRLHTRGFRHYQGYSGEERSDITINGDSVIEWDYSGLHPNLLYATEGIQYFGDPYSVLDGRPEVRPFLKHILLTMLNSKDRTTAEKSANYWLFQNTAQKKRLAKLGITRARPLIDKFVEIHQPIAHYFCKGKATGMRIMNKDSKIALDVVDHFGKQGIPILAIHDSFIVQEKYGDELYRIMREVYNRHTGFRIKIKR